jgi:glycosyltransferase involved in cell wall biosynthesis
MGMRRIENFREGAFPCITLSPKGRQRLPELAFQYLGYAPSFIKAASAMQPTLLHAHFALDAAESLPMVNALKLPLVVTLHGFDVATYDRIFQQTANGRRYLSRRERLQKTASLFVCVSDFIRKEALNRGFPSEKLRVLHNGVDTEALRPRPSPEEAKVLFVGRLVEKKGLTYLLRAMSVVQRSFPKSSLLVLGDGPLRAAHEREAVELGVNCKFLGAQPHAVVLDEMAAASVVVLPSIRAEAGDSEGLPIVLLEALALGVPAVAFANAGIPEALVEGTGFLVPDRDWELLAQKIALILENSALRASLGAGARNQIVANFNLRKQTEKLEDIYDHVQAVKMDEGVPSYVG